MIMTSVQESIEPFSLTEDTATIGGMLLRYRLSVDPQKTDGKFRIRITYSDESCEVPVGEDLFFALNCFRQLVRCAVTPCALEDVMQDQQYSLTKSGKSLYKLSEL